MIKSGGTRKTAFFIELPKLFNHIGSLCLNHLAPATWGAMLQYIMINFKHILKGQAFLNLVKTSVFPAHVG